MIIFKDMKNCSVLWTRSKVDLFYVALGEKAEPTGGNWKDQHFNALYGSEFKYRTTQLGQGTEATSRWK